MTTKKESAELKAIWKPLRDYKKDCKKLADTYNRICVYKRYQKPRILVLDCETTGLDADYNEILQLSIIDAVTGRKIFDEYFKPVYLKKWKGAERIHGISSRKVSGKRDIKPFIPIIQDILNEAIVIAGYNTSFDLDFLASYGLDWHRGSVYVYDAMEEYAMLYTEDGRWVKLTEVAKITGFDWSKCKAHNSLGDCKATLHVMKWMLKKGRDGYLEAFLKDYCEGGNVLYESLIK